MGVYWGFYGKLKKIEIVKSDAYNYDFYTPRHRVGCNSFDIVCVCVCLCVTTLTAKRTDIQTCISVCRSSERISRSSSKVKVIGQRSRSLGQKRLSGLSIVYETEYI